MTFQIRKAERKQAKLRIGVSGPSGSGKTYSALLLARGLAGSWGRVGLIDTENGSGELYSHMGDYNVLTLEAPYTPERYIEAIQAFEQSGIDVLVIDSTSHEWEGKGGCLESNEILGQTRFKGNSWGAWSVTTPRHQKFIEAIVTSPLHIITTARSKVEMIQTEDKKIKKVGMKDIQREGFEYELYVNFNIDRESHSATVSKDRTELFEKRDPFIITQQDGETLKKWAESGAAMPLPDPKVTKIASQKKSIADSLVALGYVLKTGDDVRNAVLEMTSLELGEENYEAIINVLDGAIALQNPNPAQEVALETAKTVSKKIDAKAKVAIDPIAEVDHEKKLADALAQ